LSIAGYRSRRKAPFEEFSYWHTRLATNGASFGAGHPWRRLVLPKKIENWSLTSLQQRLVKTGGRLVEHARH